MKLKHAFLSSLLILTPVPGFAQSTASQVQPGYLTTTGCPSGVSVCFKQWDSTNPMPVLTPQDYRPTSVNITARDINSVSTSGQNSSAIVTGSPTAASYATFAINGQSSVGVLVSGTWTGTLTFEASFDSGTTWFPSTVRVRGVSYSQASITANGNYLSDVAGATNFRVRSTAAMTGTAAVQATFSSAAGALQILNPIRIWDNNTGQTETIKPASTPPAATDPALVVGLNPGDPNPVTPVTTGYSIVTSVTRTNDTNVYAANDIIGAATGSTAALSFGTLGPSGQEVMITSVGLEIDAAAVIAGETSYRLYLYNITPPSALGDNAAWDLGAGDRASYLGYVDLGTPVDLGSTLYVEANGLNKQIKMAGTGVFGYLVTIGTYTPTASRVYTVTLHTMAP
jgi:hypothetical protein